MSWGRLSVLSAGMVTAVGLDRTSASAALRGKIDGFQETRFASGDGWQIGAPVPLPRNWIGERRLAHLAAGSIVDALSPMRDQVGRLALVLCLAETARPGRLVVDAEGFASRVREFAGLGSRTPTFTVEHGRPSGFVALERADAILKRGNADHVLIVGVDSLLTRGAVAHFAGRRRLLTPANSNGFLPGEAAAAILCAPGSPTHFALTGIGLGRERAFIYNGLGEDGLDLPLRGDGMTAAYSDAMNEAGVTLAGIEYRISDLIGEQYWFKQTALAALRLERGRSEFQDLWSPGEMLGNVGAAVVPLMVAMALSAYEKGYDPGSPVLIEASGDDGACGAAVFHAAKKMRKTA